jgi:hypothetical protein
LIVSLEGATVVHLGDGIIAEKSLREAGVLDASIDIGFFPFWFLTYPFGRRLIEGGFRPRHLFAVHIPPAHEVRLVREIGEFDPRAVPLVAPMEQHTVEL